MSSSIFASVCESRALQRAVCGTLAVIVGSTLVSGLVESFEPSVGGMLSASSPCVQSISRRGGLPPWRSWASRIDCRPIPEDGSEFQGVSCVYDGLVVIAVQAPGGAYFPRVVFSQPMVMFGADFAPLAAGPQAARRGPEALALDRGEKRPWLKVFETPPAQMLNAYGEAEYARLSTRMYGSTCRGR